jgi:hypothetical protein
MKYKPLSINEIRHCEALRSNPCNTSIAKEIASQSLAMTKPHHFSLFTLRSSLSQNLVKTLHPPIDNQYGLPLCQDLTGTIVMKFKKFCKGKKCQDLTVLLIRYIPDFCQDLSGFENSYKL